MAVQSASLVRTASVRSRRLSLLNTCPHPVIQIEAGQVSDASAQLGADRPGIAVVSIGRNPVRGEANDGLRQAKQRAGRLHIPMLTEQHGHQRARAVDGAIEIASVPIHLDIGFINIPAAARLAASALP